MNQNREREQQGVIARIWKAGDCESKKGRAYESVIEFEIGKAYKRMS